MPTQPLKSIKKALSHWYLITIIGVIFVLLGIWVFRTPLASYLVLATFFSISFLLSGIAEISFALGNKDTIDNWGWFLASGIFSALIGVLLLSNPALSMATLPLYVGFGIMFRAIAGVSFAFSLKDHGDEYQSMLWMSILGVVLAFLLIWNPAVIGLTLVTMTALTFIFIGAGVIWFSLKLKKLHKVSGNIKETIEQRDL
ncbi:HdeD family acid-resistance protein [Algoriphagus chordae]|uniref:Uncharacterized membrane protein HdeD (DUF308 family) n=1 Tax=Algoriphagus chordae TaxID=237019 RepID=A0A2W7RA58_9BACT|nr:DUF308 domain-containing protein [Algoriphagus chordae]PZX52547.1 uncharacterized membrane protein HdeD (DUF308 family) [Algoriphagus chordae]